jgi:Na+-driven multidrug efflux pump
LVNVIIFIAYIKIKNPVPNAITKIKKLSFSKTWEFFKYECIVGSMNFLDVVFFQVIALFTGGLSSPLQEGFTIGSNIYRLILPVAQGFAATTLTYSGISMGGANKETTQQYIKAGFFMAQIVVFVYEGFFFFFRTQIINIFLNNPDALTYTYTAFNILVLAGIAEALQLIPASGLKGIGKENSGAFVVCIVNLSMIPVGYVFCFVLEWYEIGLCFAIVLSMIPKFFLYMIVYWRMDWDCQLRLVARTIKFFTNQTDTSIYDGSISFSFTKPLLKDDEIGNEKAKE